MVGIVVLVVSLSGTDPGVRIGNAIADGQRPQAPGIPDRTLRGVPVELLPSWYKRTPDGMSGASGKVLVVNFWASWCGPCREETPMLVAIGEEYAVNGVQVIGMNPANEDAERDARDFAREFSVNYPLVRVTGPEKAEWGVRGFPETFIVGRDGRISARVNGPIDEATVVKLVERELEQRS